MSLTTVISGDVKITLKLPLCFTIINLYHLNYFFMNFHFSFKELLVEKS